MRLVRQNLAYTMDLTLLRSFLAVVDAKAVTEAADRIGVTQPALSRRLQQLEDHLGIELLARGRKGAAVTEMGKLVEAEARLIVTRYDQMRELIKTHQGLKGGTVRIGGGATAVSFILPKAIADFQQYHPDVHFHLKEAGSTEIAADVIASRLELGLVTLPVQDRELDTVPLMKDRIVLVAPKAHELACPRRTIQMNELDGRNFVGFEAGTAVRQIIDSSLRKAGVEANVVMELRSIPGILRMVAATGNLAFVSQLGIGHSNDIVEIRVKRLAIKRTLALIAKKHQQLSPAAKAFAQLIT